jgi:hypothetical protein
MGEEEENYITTGVHFIMSLHGFCHRSCIAQEFTESVVRYMLAFVTGHS